LYTVSGTEQAVQKLQFELVAATFKLRKFDKIMAYVRKLKLTTTAFLIFAQLLKFRHLLLLSLIYNICINLRPNFFLKL